MFVQNDYPRLSGTSKCLYSIITLDQPYTQYMIVRYDYPRLSCSSKCLYSTITLDQPVPIKACLAQLHYIEPSVRHRVDFLGKSQSSLSLCQTDLFKTFFLQNKFYFNMVLSRCGKLKELQNIFNKFYIESTCLY